MATEKVKRAAKIALQNPSKSMRQVALEAGYSPHTAHRPTDITESKGWKELMEHYLPDDMLAKRHFEFINSEKLTKVYKKGDLTYEEETTDPSAVKALDMAYKLKKRYGDVNIGQALILNVSEASAKKYGIKPGTRKDIERQS